MTTTLCISLYIYSAKKYESRLFVWFSLIALSIDIRFLMISLDIKKDIYYFGLMIYNGILLYVYSKNKNNDNDKVRLFLKEAPFFIRINVALSTVFLIFSYENSIFHLVNMLLSGVVLYIVSIDVKSRSLEAIVKTTVSVVWFIGLIQIYEKIYSYALNYAMYRYDFRLHFSIAVIAIFSISIAAKKFKKDMEASFFYFSHLMLPIAVSFIYWKYYDKPLLFIVPFLMYSYSVVRSKREWEIRVSLYLALLMGSIVIRSAFMMMNVNKSYHYYIMVISTMLIGVFWIIVKNEWKERVFYYFAAFSIIGLAVVVTNKIFTINEFFIVAINCAFILYIMHKARFDIMNFLPLLLLYIALHRFYMVTKSSEIRVLIITAIFFAGSKILGEVLYKRLYSDENKESNLKRLSIDWYSIFALVLISLIEGTITYKSPLWLKLIPSCMTSFWIFFQIKRVDEKIRNWVITTFIVSLIWPYYIFINKIHIPKIIEKVVYLIPLLLVTIILKKRVWINNERTMRKIEFIVVTFIAAVLMMVVLFDNKLSDILMIGGLSLISILVGMQYRIKSYFIVGSVAISLNAFFQTRHLWGTLPWWMYLLIAGLILIGHASINEMDKGSERKLIKIDKEKIKEKFKDWK